MEVYGALGTQIKVRVSLPSKGLGTPAARAEGPRADKRNVEVPSPGRQVASTCGGRWEGGTNRGMSATRAVRKKKYKIAL